MNQGNEVFQRVEEFLSTQLRNVDFDEDARSQIDLYLENREYEMAFEGFFLELMDTRQHIALDRDACLQMAIDLNLDKETVFDVDFWIKLQKFLDA